MKILVDAHIFDHSYQGTHTYIKGLYTALVSEPQVQIFLCARNTENLKIHFPDSRFKIIQLKSKSKWRRLAFELPSLAKHLEVDFAHFQYIIPFFKKARYIVTIHDILFCDYPQFFPRSYRIIKRFLFKWSALNADLVFTVSEFSKQALIHHFHINSNKIIITPNAVTLKTNATEMQINDLPEKYILYVSRFEPRKNQIGLLKSFVRLKLHLQGFHLLLVGSKKDKIENNYFNELKKNISSELIPFVHFKENLNPDELIHYYQKSVCMVYPSYAEGFGIPPLEAAVLETKVLCSNTTAMSDFSFLKYRFNPMNEFEFDEIFKELLQDNNYPFEEIRRAVIERFNWQDIANKTYIHLSLLLKN